MSHETTNVIDAMWSTIITPVIAATGWFAHTTLITKRFPDAVQATGGILTAGFVAWAFNGLFTATGMHADVSSSISAILGASGHAGFAALVKIAKKAGGVE